jgi:hypothetical protein
MAAPKKKNDGTFHPSPDTKRVVSLNKGTWAYVFDGKGKKHHVKRSSELMIIVCKQADTDLNGRITAELEELGWIDVLERMAVEA